jgi:hypothetical protein
VARPAGAGRAGWRDGGGPGRGRPGGKAGRVASRPGRGGAGRAGPGGETVVDRGEAGRVARRWWTGARRAGWRDGGRPGQGRLGRCGPGGETVADWGGRWRTGARLAGWRYGGGPGGGTLAGREEGLSSSGLYGSEEQRGSGGGTNLLRDRACGRSGSGTIRGGGIVLAREGEGGRQSVSGRPPGR